MNHSSITLSIFGLLIVGAAAHCFAAGPPIIASWAPSQDAADAATLQATPLFETTSFEPPEWDAYTSGQSNFMCGAAYWNTCTPTPIADSCTGNPVADVNCCSAHPNPFNGWYVSSSSQQCHEPHIDTANPANPGGQHLRFAHDPAGGNPAGCVGFDTACRVNAFTPDMGPQGFGPTTISFDLSISNMSGPSLEYFTIGSDGRTGTFILFGATGVISIFDASLNQNVNVGQWLAGAYHSIRIEKTPFCARLINYYYDNQLIYSAASDQETPNVERAIFQTDNDGGTSDFVDVDNYLVQRFPDLCHECGDGVLGLEECEPSVPGSGGCPPGRCNFDCTCTPICTLNAPCPLHNGSNGPFLGPCQPGVGCIFTITDAAPALEVDFCGTVGADTYLQIYDATNLAVVLASNDDCENTDGFGAGSTPNASCFNNVATNFESCTCATSPSGQYLIREASNPGNGVAVMVNVNKKVACGQAILGSCCISNGPAFGCHDNVLQADCTGSWSNQKCADRAPCLCVPNCAGRTCGDDGCGGSCGSCDDHNVCNGSESCDVNGQCVAGTPLNCDDGLFCNGAESCNSNSGCQSGAPPNCNDSIACTADLCNEAIRGCSHTPNDSACDDGVFCNGAETCTLTGCTSGAPPCTADEICDESASSCSPRFVPIPTVSQWGLIMTAVALLIGAKVMGRGKPA